MHQKIFLLQAVLMTIQNTQTHSPLADTPVLHSDCNEFNFKAEDQKL